MYHSVLVIYFSYILPKILVYNCAMSNVLIFNGLPILKDQRFDIYFNLYCFLILDLIG